LFGNKSTKEGESMRRSMGQALGLALLMAASAQAQTSGLVPSTANDTGPGFFGFMPKLFGAKPTVPDPNNFPIPNRTLPGFTYTDAFSPTGHSPIGQLNHAVTNIPTYNPLMPLNYLSAFHYRPAQPVHR
jgi:hypothetical protein